MMPPNDLIEDWRSAAIADVRNSRLPILEWTRRLDLKLDRGQRVARPSEMRIVPIWEQAQDDVPWEGIDQ